MRPKRAGVRRPGGRASLDERQPNRIVEVRMIAGSRVHDVPGEPAVSRARFHEVEASSRRGRRHISASWTAISSPKIGPTSTLV